MSDSLPTVWPIEPHMQAKHAILSRYLQAWLPILTTQSHKMGRQSGKTQRVLYIDGFAGPGVYREGEPGSPLIAIDAAIKHRSFPTPVEMLFIEARSDRFERLQESIQSRSDQLKGASNVHVVDLRKGDCDEVLGGLLTEYSNRGVEFGPALAFLDQFGYGNVSMELIKKILGMPQCEIFTYLNYKEINRFITDDHKAPALNRAFGGSEWRECVALQPDQRRGRLLELYKVALRDRGGAEYVSSFLMHDSNDIPLYWLIFGTNSIRGLEEMKKAMWAVDTTGGFHFSDRDNPDQLRLLNVAFDQEWLAGELERQLVGQTRTVEDVYKFVLTQTPCYQYTEALKSMENDGRLKVKQAPSGRRKGSFGPDRPSIIVEFQRRRPSQKPLF